MDLRAAIISPRRALAPTATEYVRIAISPAPQRGPFPDLTGTPVAVAFRGAKAAMDNASPQAHEWTAASWEDDSPGRGVIAILVGPHGAIDPGPGQHFIWAEIITPPEVTVIRAQGFLTIQ